MIQILEKVYFFVSHCTVDFYVLCFSVLKSLFDHRSFSSCSGTINKKVHSTFQESSESDLIGNHFFFTFWLVNIKYWANNVLALYENE